jgi:endonuclease/exonuclease/phosphatase family metal-dependent hydrolase
MNETQILVEHTIKIASLNLHNNPDSYQDRVTAAVREARNSNVDVVLAQEIADKELVVELFKEAGYVHSTLCDSVASKRNPDAKASTGVFSRIQLSATRELALTALPGSKKASIAVLDYNGYEVHVISTHFAWGADNGAMRLRQAMLISDYARRTQDKNSKAVIVVAGTLNDTPHNDSVRYLLGQKSEDGKPSTFWVDATYNTEAENVNTTRSQNKWGKAAALQAGVLRPSALHDQRLDYMFVYGWVYGRPGMPVEGKLFGVDRTPMNEDISDHFGIQSLIWLPPTE